MRKVIAVLLLVAAAAGLVYGILGLTMKTVPIHAGDAQGVYDLAKNSYAGSVGFSTRGGLSVGIGDLKKLANEIRSRQIYLVFGVFAVCGLAGIRLLRRKRY